MPPLPLLPSLLRIQQFGSERISNELISGKRSLGSALLRPHLLTHSALINMPLSLRDTLYTLVMTRNKHTEIRVTHPRFPAYPLLTDAARSLIFFSFLQLIQFPVALPKGGGRSACAVGARDPQTCDRWPAEGNTRKHTSRHRFVLIAPGGYLPRLSSRPSLALRASFPGFPL